MSKIEIDTDKIQPLVNMLYLSNEPKVYKLASYIKTDKNQAEFGNTCQDYQNYMYETFGIWLHNNHLSESNKKSVNDFIDKINKKGKADDPNKQERQSDVLISTIEKCEILEKKLEIAVNAFQWVEEQADTSTQYDYDAEVILKNIVRDCQEALAKIKEIK